VLKKLFPCFPLLVVSTHVAAAVSVQVFSGVMLQPNSQYFHAINGTALTLTSESHQALASISYAERPRFSAYGFTDQEAAIFVTAGRIVPIAPQFAWHVSAGFGQQFGYLTDEFFEERRSYSMRGLAAKGEFIYSVQHLFLGFGHESLIGLETGLQMRTFVAWPYNYFHLSLGFNV
jgi:hypothetical protein